MVETLNKHIDGGGAKSPMLRELLGVEQTGAAGVGSVCFPDLAPVLMEFNDMFDLSEDLVKVRPLNRAQPNPAQSCPA